MIKLPHTALPEPRLYTDPNYRWIAPMSYPKNGRLIIELDTCFKYIAAVRYVERQVRDTNDNNVKTFRQWIDLNYENDDAPKGPWIPFPTPPAGIIKVPDYEAWKQEGIVRWNGNTISEETAETPEGSVTPPKWLPMSDAPHDGSLIIALQRDGKDIQLIRRGIAIASEELLGNNFEESEFYWTDISLETGVFNEESFVAFLPCPFIDPHRVREEAVKAGPHVSFFLPEPV